MVLGIAAIGSISTSPGSSDTGECRLSRDFQELYALIPSIAGECVDRERPGPEEGDRIQATTKGLFIRQQATGTVAFTDGIRSWINGPEGVETHLNGERFAQAQGTSHFAQWSYEGLTGPDYWGGLKAEYAPCREGLQQSPIDLAGAVRDTLLSQQFDYAPTPLEIVNNGHSIQINYVPGSTLTVDGQQYELLQFHFHYQSEHTVGGRPFGMEAHIVHRSSRGHLAVVGILLQEGAPNAFLQSIWRNFPREGGVRPVPGAAVNVADLLPQDQRYFTYSGSLTTPPCTEVVTWYVLQKPVQVSSNQIAQFAALFPPTNARPVQALQGRFVRASA